MRRVPLLLPDEWVKIIDEYVAKHEYTNRSDAIRDALRDWILKKRSINK
jgi:Arc/MetJ-type ribon-helix-helix transcriptional regulator